MMKQNPHPFTLRTPSLLITTQPLRWNVQWEHPGGFYAQEDTMTMRHLEDVLRGKCWIATYAPDDGVVDRIEFDLDCKGVSTGAAGLHHRYRAIREVIGPRRRPMVVRTPSGGLHMSYRIPPTGLEELIEGLEAGLVADVLRAAGLTVGRGTIEIYPQRKQCKRLPIGRSMALLDPDTLSPIAVAPARPSIEAPEWHTFFEILQEWHQQVHWDLMEHLRTLPRDTGRGHAPTAGRGTGSPDDSDMSQTVQPATARLLAEGLTRSSSRYEVEFKVGAAFWRDPSLIPGFGGAKAPTREDVARGVAEWLAEHHNGYSKEWSADRRHRSVADVLKLWTERYLDRGSDGQAPVDRMRRAALAAAADCGFVSPADMQEIRVLGEELFSAGPQRYQFETWTCSLLRAVKSVVRYRRRRGEDVIEGDGFVEVEILARWMEQWPWGSGRLRGVRNYVTYRDALLSRGWIVPVSAPRWCADLPDLPGEATRYRVRPPRLVQAAALGWPPEIVESRIRRLQVSGRALTLEEAYHALHVAETVRRLERAYGSSTAESIRRYVDAIHNPF